MAKEERPGQAEDPVKSRVREAGERARAEAEARRKQKPIAPEPKKEIDGRDGPDPVRFGDWEKKGIASDF